MELNDIQAINENNHHILYTSVDKDHRLEVTDVQVLHPPALACPVTQ